MIEKKTIIDQIEITRNGTVQVRLALLLVEDGNEIDCKWHRTAIVPGGSVDDQITLVNSHLAQMGKEPLTEGIDRIKAQAEAAWTPEVLAAYNSAVA